MHTVLFNVSSVQKWGSKWSENFVSELVVLRSAIWLAVFTCLQYFWFSFPWMTCNLFCDECCIESAYLACLARVEHKLEFLGTVSQTLRLHFTCNSIQICSLTIHYAGQFSTCRTDITTSPSAWKNAPNITSCFSTCWLGTSFWRQASNWLWSTDSLGFTGTRLVGFEDRIIFPRAKVEIAHIIKSWWMYATLKSETSFCHIWVHYSTKAWANFFH